jgi:hypothetical protein
VTTSGNIGASCPNFYGERWTGTFIYALSAVETSPAFVAAPAHKSKPVFLPLQMPLPYPAAMAFSRQRRQSV